MPQVIRRTPETEEASQYSYRDLLRDIIRKKLESSGAQSRRMLSGKMTEEDVANVGLSGVGGMLKVHGTGKLLAGLLKKQKLLAQDLNLGGGVLETLAPGRIAFKEALKEQDRTGNQVK